MVLLRVLLGFTLFWISDATYDLAPRERCVPTATARGPCHACVCDVDGVYYCRAHACQITNVTITIRQGKRECQPHKTYRDGALFCSCSNDGYWISKNCRDKFRIMKSPSTLPIQMISTNIQCTPNYLYLLDCNICECGENGIIKLSSCTNRKCKRGSKVDTCGYGDILRTNDELCSCSDINLYIDRLCLKVKDKAIQSINRTDLGTIITIEKPWKRAQEVYLGACVPGSVIIFNCNRCFCTPQKVWGCTLKGCVPPEIEIDALRSQHQEKAFYNTPVLKNLKEHCKPGMKYRYKCNSCVCSKKGFPICTSMVCLEELLVDGNAFEQSYRESFKSAYYE